MILHVADMNDNNFYGHEWYKMLLTWMSLPFTDMNDTNSTDMIVPIFYIHEYYYMVLTRMLFYEHEWYYMLLTWMLVSLRTWMILHVTDMNALTFTYMSGNECYWHEYYWILRTWITKQVTDMNVTNF